MEVIYISQWEALILAFILIIIELCCLYLGLLAYKRYIAALYFSFCRCSRSYISDWEYLQGDKE